ncbi:MAG TPA: hypothetical protein VGP68_12645 [Gemmataceae bacterium]|jgi:hypothetical protein|nr:hypothetical protein [Gemmataceae bacterium]
MEASELPPEKIDTGPHFAAEVEPDSQAWEEIEAGRFMPRRIRGSYRGRALG